MIKHTRVDERLIHGQVASVWVNSLGCDRIIVANDSAVKDPMQIEALKIACPTAVKLSLLSLEKAAANIQAGKYDSDKVFLITKTIPDCKRLIDLGVKLERFNVGNLKHNEGQKKIKKSVSLSDEDISIINDLISQGILITAQMLPNESDTSIDTFL